MLREAFDERDQAMASVQAMLDEARRDAQYTASKSEQFSTKTDISDIKAEMATKTELAAVKADLSGVKIDGHRAAVLPIKSK